MLQRFTTGLKRDTRATVAVVYALATLPVFGAAGLAIDMSRIVSNTSKMQSAVDAAALTALSVRVPTDAQRVSAANAAFDTNYAGGLTTTTSANGDSKIFTVASQATMPTTLMAIAGFDEVPLSVTATAAKVFQGPPPCILALNRTVAGGVTITGSADFQALGCVVHANSKDVSGMVLDGTNVPVAAGFCAVGGVKTVLPIQPPPKNYCDDMADPFAGLALPTAGACNYSNVEVSPKQTVTLNPGVYCGGLTLKGQVTLNPGMYIMKDGPLVITSQSRVTGSDVSFTLTGTNTGFTIDGGGGSQLEAPKTGTYGGMLIMQERTSNPGFTNELTGGSSSLLMGAIYTPTQKVTATGGAGFNALSPYMPIVADQIRVSGSMRSKIDLAGIDPAAPLPASESAVRLVN